jgi:hypothetical protein
MRIPKTMTAIFAAAAATATVILLAGAITTVASGQAMANADIAKKTSQPCAKCHTAPPALNDYGKNYKDSVKK